MVEEATKDKKSPEMTPQEDGTKVPLTNENAATIEEAKYVSNPNGDAKIDVEVPPTFAGLTKEELMKYSNDPFWVRLRWFLFVLFWAGWLAMLVIAIIIIIQEPGCKPPPERLWVEEEVMIEIDDRALPDPADLNMKCDEMGVASIYLPGLISISSFDEANYDARDLIDGLVKEEKKVVTDLILSVDPTNVFFANLTSQGLIKGDSSWNYTNEALPSFIYEHIVDVWIAKGVTGFLMRDANTKEKVVFKEKLNDLCEGKGGAVGSDILKDEVTFESVSMFKDFLDEHSEFGNWSFYKYNPSYIATGSEISEEHHRLITMGLFLAPGTPILVNYEVSNSTAELVSSLSNLRSEDAIKLGNTSFVNSTDDNVVAYTRVKKGTPAYAVALNFNTNRTSISFVGTEHVGSGKGVIELSSDELGINRDRKEKYDLNNVSIGPFEGLVLQFVAEF